MYAYDGRKDKYLYAPASFCADVHRLLVVSIGDAWTSGTVCMRGRYPPPGMTRKKTAVCSSYRIYLYNRSTWQRGGTGNTHTLGKQHARPGQRWISLFLAGCVFKFGGWPRIDVSQQLPHLFIPAQKKRYMVHIIARMLLRGACQTCHRCWWRRMRSTPRSPAGSRPVGPRSPAWCAFSLCWSDRTRTPNCVSQADNQAHTRTRAAVGGCQRESETQALG